jgi:hypothetical protein
VSVETPEALPRPGFNPDIGKATRFQKGNTARLVTGAYSATVRARDRQAAAALAKAGITQALSDACAEMETELQSRQGFACTIAQRGLVRRYNELDGLASYLFAQLMDGTGPMTASGKVRRCFDHYTKVVERQTKIAIALGLPRMPAHATPRRPVLPSIHDYRPADDEQGAP